MAVGFELNVVSNLKDINQKLVTFNRKLKDRVYLKLIHQRFIKWIGDNFRNQGTDKAWKPLSPNTIFNRREKGKGGVQILRDSGRMAMSFVPGRSGYGGSINIAQGIAIVGTQDKKAPWHEEGVAPFQIRPKNKKLLVFNTARGLVFSKLVNHPGLAARKILPSAQAGNEMINDIGNAYMRKIIEEAKH
jgi:hypothetical protein